MKYRDLISKTWQSVVPEETRRKFYHWRHNRLADSKAEETGSVTRRDFSEPTLINRGLVSIVIPVYKVEEYLDECVNSVLSQSYKNVEVILVDDGSPDRCGEMCDQFAKHHDNVVVLHQPNGGLSNARNNGLKAATGEYVMFMDSDDIITPNAVNELLSPLVEMNADIATGNVERMKGSRRWQSWNQTYSHAKIETWDGNTAAPVATTVTLKDAPELIFDATAWNKLFRTEFLRRIQLQFPEGKFYEDMLPMAEAFLAANRIVKVASTVYLYREREDNTSITQKRGQVKNLADKMEMVWHIEDRLVSNNSPRALFDTLYFKALEGDLAVYSPHVGEDEEFDQIYLSELAKCWEKSSAKIKLALALDRRALYINQLFSKDYRNAENESAWFSTHFHDLPLVYRAGRVQADADFAPEHMAILGEHNLLDMSRYVELKQVVTDAYVRDGEAVVEGFAFLDHLPGELDHGVTVSLVDSSGAMHALSTQRCKDERANGYWRSGNADRSGSAFIAKIAISDLQSSSIDLNGQMAVLIAVEAGSYTRSEYATGYWRGGSIRLGEIAEAEGGRRFWMPWQPWGSPLKLESEVPAVRATSFDRSESVVRVKLEFDRTYTGVQVDAVRVWDGLRVSLSKSDEVSPMGAWFAGDLEGVERRSDSGGNLNAWKFEVRADGLSDTVEAVGSTAWSTGTQRTRTWSTRCSSESVALLHDGYTTLSVDEITPLDDGFLLHGTGWFEDHPGFTAEMWSDRGALQPVTSVRVIDATRFEIEIKCLNMGERSQPLTWEPGEYRFRLFDRGRRGSQYKIRSGRDVVYNFPLTTLHDRFRSRWHLISDTWELALGIDAPQLDTERGRYNVSRMNNYWAGKEDLEAPPINAAVFSVNMGAGSADSQLEILKELRERLPEWEFYWAVTDYSVPVPNGARALVRQTEQWFEVLSRARLVVNNYGGIAGYGDREYQRYLQTWHGTPLKHIGDSEFRGDARAYARKRMIAKKEAMEWDWVVSPSRVVTEIIRRDLYFDGPILEKGYPRNDSLAKATNITQYDCKVRIGIEDEAKVLLYAPTFRDVSAQGFSSPLVEYLELERLANELGDDWTILLRGHSFNARSSDKNRSSSRVIDVTKYPDVNDLMIACDVMVTDYSSIMFDYLVTEKPIVYFAPDIEEYVANRGMYFEYREVLAGEVATSQDELLRHITSLANISNVQPSAAYMQQKARFVPHDDGGAASRVVDAVLREMPLMQSPPPRKSSSRS